MSLLFKTDVIYIVLTFQLFLSTAY